MANITYNFMNLCKNWYRLLFLPLFHGNFIAEETGCPASVATCTMFLIMLLWCVKACSAQYVLRAGSWILEFDLIALDLGRVRILHKCFDDAIRKYIMLPVALFVMLPSTDDSITLN